MLQPEKEVFDISVSENIDVSNPISGEVGAAAGVPALMRDLAKLKFQTPSAGRWVLQPAAKKVVVRAEGAGFKPHQRGGGCCSPRSPTPPSRATPSFKPHQRGGGCCSKTNDLAVMRGVWFQTPSAGRWVLQLGHNNLATNWTCTFQTPSAGRWVLQHFFNISLNWADAEVSNPISGEVGAAAPG